MSPQRGRSVIRASSNAFNHNGLIIEDSPGTREFQKPYARPRSEIDGWDVADPHRVNLLETIRNAQPTILIGTSARGGHSRRKWCGRCTRTANDR